MDFEGKECLPLSLKTDFSEMLSPVIDTEEGNIPSRPLAESCFSEGGPFEMEVMADTVDIVSLFSICARIFCIVTTEPAQEEVS